METQTTERKMNIFESIAAVQADVDFISKDKQITQGGNYKYRGVDQVLNTLHPLFSKHKVFAVPEVLNIEAREERTTRNGGTMIYQVLKVKYTFYAEDGTSIPAVVLGEAMDSGDKVSNKCMSVAYKYACFQVLSIPTEETTADPDDTNEAFTPRSAQTQRATAQTAQNGKQTAKTAQPEEELVTLDEARTMKITKGDKEYILGDLTYDQLGWFLKKTTDDYTADCISKVMESLTANS